MRVPSGEKKRRHHIDFMLDAVDSFELVSNYNTVGTALQSTQKQYLSKHIPMSEDHSKQPSNIVAISALASMTIFLYISENYKV